MERSALYNPLDILLIMVYNVYMIDFFTKKEYKMGLEGYGMMTSFELYLETAGTLLVTIFLLGFIYMLIRAMASPA